MITRLLLRGRVQGVGMRPCLYRVAVAHRLKGWAQNTEHGVEVQLHANAQQIDDFLLALRAQLPALAQLDAVDRSVVAEQPQAMPAGFELRPPHKSTDTVQAQVLPDIATCADCRAEINNPKDRRYRYPFTHCVQCGPRISIQRALPWERQNTAMADYRLCADCKAEYENPADRRFHAQPIACPNCGPQCWLSDALGTRLADAQAALSAAIGHLRDGRIVAIKSVGGFHLACDALSADAVARLRLRKQRPAKPLALMGRDVAMLKSYVAVDAQAEQLLCSDAAPIVLLPMLADLDARLVAGLAPGLNRLGVMLPASPLQQLLLDEMKGPLVMTSGNASGQALCTDNALALEQLAEIADVFLLHDREIVTRLDDTVMQIAAGNMQTLRVGRGVAPLRSLHGHVTAPPVLALGGHLKASFALLHGSDWTLSEHIGDLENLSNWQDYQGKLQQALDLYRFKPDVIAIDAHPDYATHQFGQALVAQTDAQLISVQHHHAHAVSVLAEHNIAPSDGPWLAVCFDGLGYGVDGELWGGEFLELDYSQFHRRARLRPARLIGGLAALREPWRNLYALIDDCMGWERYTRLCPCTAHAINQEPTPAQLQAVLTAGLNSPSCSSAGRHFDALACLLGVAPARLQYEAQAAMQVQALAETCRNPLNSPKDVCAALELNTERELWELDWRACWRSVLMAHEQAVPSEQIAAQFHQVLATGIADTCVALQTQRAVSKEILLCGGVFQNRLLLEATVQALAERGLQAEFGRKLPCNDGGLALGQAYVAAATAQSA